MRQSHSIVKISILALLLLATIILTSCGGDSSLDPKVENENSTLPQAEVTFFVSLPYQPAMSQGITLDIIDDVTGYGARAKRLNMEIISPNQYKVVANIPIGSLVKYRYTRSDDVAEYSSLGIIVDYRLCYVTGPMIVNDIISAWQDTPYTGPAGRVEGKVTNYINNAPLPSVIVGAGGISVLSASDGSFVIEGLPPGTHNLTAFSLDGNFKPFQQGASVAEGAVTPAEIRMESARLVNITFIVTPPANHIQGAPLRIVGNLYSLGNTFADPRSNSSILPIRAPLLSNQEGGTYSLTLSLPEGYDLRYKYTLGDGYVNSERTLTGTIRTRQLIVPAIDTTIAENIESWQETTASPVTFKVKAPENTPPIDSVSIQYKIQDWSAPIPLWPMGNNEWSYRLYAPLQANMEYRYCRNDQCGIADETGNAGPRIVNVNPEGQTVEDLIVAWVGWQPSGVPTTIIAEDIKPRDASFIAGVEFSPSYEPIWQSYFPAAYQNLNDFYANWVVLSPTWSVLTANPPSISIVIGKDPIWFDNTQAISWAKQKDLKVAIYPRVIFPVEFSQSGQASIEWWYQWFTYYKSFVLHHADLAEQTGADALILGGKDVWMSLPEAKAEDGTPSLTPPEFIDYWNSLLDEVRSRYHGEIIFAVPYPSGLQSIPSVLSKVDRIYMELSAPLASTDNPTQADIETELSRILDQSIQPYFQTVQKPIILALSYASADTGAKSCSDCEFGLSSHAINLQIQIDIYTTALRLINQREWITGIIAGDYYPPAAMQDASASVHGKPVSDIFWYWFPRLLGISQ